MISLSPYRYQFKITTYSNNNRLAIVQYYWNNENKDFEPWANVTVNIVSEENIDNDEAFIDVNNNEEVIELLEQYEIITFTGRTAQSGYCRYPLYRFNLQKLEEYRLYNGSGKDMTRK